MDPFLGPWKIDDWKPEGLGRIPANGFKKGGPLNITPGSVVNSVDLHWDNEDNQSCSVSGLRFDLGNNWLEGQNLEARFAGEKVQCHFQVELVPDEPKKTLTLSINTVREISGPQGDTMALPEVGSGVVTATADAGG
ncbi:MAG TPA: hypothetical protein VKK31_02635 [Thermoanaerobaculia bacterium]|nr:hypothetical protein [Thermoanaerobaculia bacterium]